MRDFYENTFGFSFVASEGGTLLFNMNGTPLRISQVADFTPQSFSVLGWSVTDINTQTDALLAAVVEPKEAAGMC